MSGWTVIFKLFRTQQTKHVFALNHWGMQMNAGMICVVIRTACALVMNERGKSWSEGEYLAPKVNPAKSTQHNNQQNKARDRDGMRFGMGLYNERATLYTKTYNFAGSALPEADIRA